MLNIITKLVHMFFVLINSIKNSFILIPSSFLKITPISSKRDYLGMKHNSMTFILKSHDELDELKLKFLVGCSNLLPLTFNEECIYINLISKTDMITKYKKDEDIAGFVSNCNRMKLIYIRNDLNFTCLRNTFLHEIGHVVDMLLAEKFSPTHKLFTESDTELKKLFYLEKNIYSYTKFDSNNKLQTYFYEYGTDIAEYFAQSFCNTVLCDATFIKYAPQTHSKIENMISILQNK